MIQSLRETVADAKARHPEIVQVWLFGSLVEGAWTADSDADLIIVVRREFKDLFDRSHYQIHSPEIPTDSLVYSEAEFEELARDASSFVAQNLEKAVEL
ncbi:MAG TPA: nucleotidyltransferase domain-containing protein [Terriglobia bacterium]|nr:nucleotidyltransferase domain-containing protein [Terriglobia bacterium]